MIGEGHMEVFTEFLQRINIPSHRERTEEVLTWVKETFPQLEPVLKWNQPMFTDHDTFIIGFSVSKNHIAVAPEREAISQFENDIVQAGYDYAKEIIRIPWTSPVNYDLLEKIIEFNIIDKKDCTTFWRK